MQSRQKIILETVERLFEIDRTAIANRLKAREHKLESGLDTIESGPAFAGNDERIRQLVDRLAKVRRVRKKAEGK